ncbi:HYR domain-containing protein [Stigmatella sp. ncwal1]|uniref:HYR domain-containing protein n=1 Tax=Stigmatella ashevillensis TaxID=2995309 RepID=A0ABT5D0F4_9BACT|nr:HYR domain-containing protein [Stigmatella ashevillena]MDC0707061.1 HYR domain-containing protein [Stigmatella ashevillena]
MKTAWQAVGWLTLGWMSLGGCSEPETRDEAPPASHTAHRQGVGATVPAQLVRDIHSSQGSTPGSSPSYFTVSGSNAYFFASEASSGRELWKTDGTAAGTRLVKDFVPGTSSPSGLPQTNPPRAADDPPLVALGGQVYFSLAHTSWSLELWRTDGTATGTVQVKDFCPLACSNSLRFLMAFNGRLFFALNDTEGAEPWTSDGTEVGTQRLANISPGSGSSSPHAFTAWKGALYFLATSSSASGEELWRTDGTPAGTVRVALGSSYSKITALAPVGDVLYFAASDASGEELWRTDGTLAGTRKVSDLNPGSASSSPRALTAAGGRLYFVANTDMGSGLWVTDGTADGTVMLQQGLYDTPRSLAPLGQRLFFVSGDLQTGMEPWVTDGTPEGTQMLANLWPDKPSRAYSSDPGVLSTVGNSLYFTANLPDAQGSLWVTDGTPEGTQRVSGGPDGLGIVDIRGGGAALGGQLLVSGLNPSALSGFDPFMTDGTSEGTRRVKNINPPRSSSSPAELTAAGGRLYLRASDGTSGSELWTSDGTPAGTRLLDLKPGASSSQPQELKALGDWVLFFSSFRREELWRSDGTAAGTLRLKTFQPLPTSNQFGRAVLFEGFHYFTAVDSGGLELWRSNGTPEGTSRVIDLMPGAQSGMLDSELFSMGNRLYFMGNDGVRGQSLWRTDGTETGTQLVRENISPLRHFVDRNGTLFFAGDVSLWKSDGTGAGTQKVRSHSISISSLTLLDGTLYYFAGNELWRSTGTSGGTTKVATFDTQNTAISAPLVPMRGALFFSVQSPIGNELWRSDGTLQGTGLFREFLPGPASGVDHNQPFLVLHPEELLLLVASDESTGREIWATDGVDSWRVTDIAPQEGNTNPTSLMRMGDFVYFTADDGTGAEPWRIPVQALVDTTPPSLTCPANRPPLEATAPGGALVTYPPAVASDDRTSVLNVTYSQTSGTTFPLGTHTVTATVKDTAGNATSCSFQVQVRDTQPPTLTCPASLFRQATGPDGAAVSYSSARSSDTVSAVTLSYSHASGSTFPVGGTSVLVTATDASGNSKQCHFAVTVRDSTPPSITCPAPVFAEATLPSGTLASYPDATATDIVTPSPEVTYQPVPGTLLPFGLTSVVATAKDASGNTAACSFTMTVRDTTPPEVSCPEDLTTEPTREEGRPVDFPPATAHDAVTPEPELTYDPAPGSTFPLGTTIVTVQARDAAANSASCFFRVTVPRELTVPDAGTDAGPQPPDDAGTQPTDDAGTQPGTDGGVSTPPEEDTSGCGCSADSPAASAGWGALLLLGWTVTRRRARRG